MLRGSLVTGASFRLVGVSLYSDLCGILHFLMLLFAPLRRSSRVEKQNDNASVLGGLSGGDIAGGREALR